MGHCAPLGALYITPLSEQADVALVPIHVLTYWSGVCVLVIFNEPHL